MNSVPAARPMAASFTAQGHWFAGRLREARAAYETMLERFPHYCRGLTIENDFAVALHALGDLGLAETMARRSLASWAGVPHTQTLSHLVLGSVLTSAGRHGEARAELNLALELAHAQKSARFQTEAQVRLARLAWTGGDVRAAQTLLEACEADLAVCVEPLRASAYWQLRVSVAADQGHVDACALQRLRDPATLAGHPVALARRDMAEWSVATQRGASGDAQLAALRLKRLAAEHGMDEWLHIAQTLLERMPVRLRAV